MKKFNTSPISGMQELTPALQAEFDRLKAGIAAAYHAHGFLHIETPMIERTEVLLAKAGGDTEKQIYKVVKTTESAEGADQALRFDHTVPLARYTVEHQNELAFPFKVTQIARNFRGERAQKGRFREFYQCDADIIGWGELPISYDAEVIATLVDAMRVLPFPKVIVRVSNRKLLNGLLEELKLEAVASEIFSIIDHAEKVPAEKTVAALQDLGISVENVVKITTFMQIHGALDEVLAKLHGLDVQNTTFTEGLEELQTVLELVPQLVQSEQAEVIADMLIVRGLDYYTGTVFETIAPGYEEIGSIGGGGRYENLAGYYTDQTMPGVGGSIGLTRLFWALKEHELVKVTDVQPVDVCLVPISANEYAAAAGLAKQLRAAGKVVDLVLTKKKLGDKLKYAAKVANYVAVIGEEEVESGVYKFKNLKTGEDSFSI